MNPWTEDLDKAYATIFGTDPETCAPGAPTPPTNPDHPDTTDTKIRCTITHTPPDLHR